MIKNRANLKTTQRGSESLALERSEPVPMLIVLLVLALATLIAFPTPGLGATTTELEADAYGFVSRVEGDALLSGLEGDDAIEAEINHPLLTGDEITTNTGRIELVLPDGTLIRVGRETSVVFEALAGSPDSEVESGSFVTLDQGELQIRTPETFLDNEDLAIQTPNATVYLGPAGSYRITAEDSTFTEVVVREGFAEADTRSGSGIARVGDALEITGYNRPIVRTVEAGPADVLELWAEDLDRTAYTSSRDEIDQRLAYAAAPLEDAGEWVLVDSRRAWRPYVRADWRPFRYGRWVYTPSGLTWVASARWGWVTSHYGSWDYVPGYGWLWLPGNVYMPAGVYWYWGPTHVAWIPNGYYSRHYRSGFRFGVHGWAGGDWGYWADWTFCPTRYFGRRGYDRYWDSGRNLGRERRFAVPRGIVTTDTRGLGPKRWGKPTEVLDTLVKRADPQGRGRSLPDVTGFVARRELTKVPTIKAFEQKVSVRERLQPLPEESKRSRFGTRSVATGTSRGSRSLSRVDDRKDYGARARFEDRGTLRQRSDRKRSVAGEGIESGARSKRDELPSDRSSDRKSIRERGSSLDRSLSDRSTGPESAPARRVLDRIRAHRETTRGSSSNKSTGLSRQGQGKAKSVSKGSNGGSAKAPARSSSSSARDSGSNRSSAKKSSPPPRKSSSSARSSGSNRSSANKSSPPRSSSNRSSGARSGSGSRSKSRSKD